ncbi:MAG: nitrite reductase small subunit NirD [Nocardioides sp.]
MSTRISDEQRQETYTEICHVDDIEVEGGVLALVAGEAIAVFRTHDDEVYALSNFDPVARASVMARGIVGTRAGAPYVASPVYKQGYDLRTGACLDNPEGETVRVPTYEVRISADRTVLVGPRQEIRDSDPGQ